MTQSKSPKGIRAVAIFEASKAALVMLGGFGLLALVHRDVQNLAERFIERMHLNPAREYPHIFIEAASHVTDAHLWTMAWLAFVYTLIRAVEAYGLWHERRWAEWFALGSAAVYMPIEVYEIFHHITWVKVSILLMNGAVVAYMAYALYHSRKKASESSAAD